jgi:hypothetical protein
MPKKYVSILMLVTATSALQACSVAYDLQQDAALDACKKIVDWNQRTECLNKNKTTYEQYEKQRQDVIKK